MSSIQSFLRQRSQTSTFFQAPTNACYYNFVAGPGNYVGNYPPGYMALAVANPVPSAGSLIRDMGKTVVSSARTFRKVQYVISTNSTFGVGGKSGTTPVVDYLTGYVELGFEGGGVPTPVAHFGR